MLHLWPWTCSGVDVPQHAVGFVTGKGGNFLRTIEEEWTVIMFFVEFSNDRKRDIEKLAIFGTKRGRKGADKEANQFFIFENEYNFAIIFSEISANIAQDLATFVQIWIYFCIFSEVSRNSDKF